MNELLQNQELSKYLDNLIRTKYYKFQLSFIIEYDDFMQECYIFLIKRIKNFDSEKANVKTFITMVVMSCARTCIQLANGSSKDHNKLDFKNNTISLDFKNKNKDDKTTEFIESVGVEDDVDTKVFVHEILNSSSLTPNQKLILKLKYEGYSTSDIAEMVGRTSSCINKTFDRAKEKIVRKYAL
jgi:RNA polymerase sigma factor (sigma-70 family)